MTRLFTSIIFWFISYSYTTNRCSLFRCYNIKVKNKSHKYFKISIFRKERRKI
nr:MAG TPA: hypothetical protein [Caudoviricetes sp.]